MERIDKIIFVCTGNTCRSPMAESLYYSMELGEKIEVISRGLVVLFPEPINPKAEIVLKNHGLELKEHITKQFQNSEVNEFTLILSMTEQQKQVLEKDYNITENCYTLKEFANEIGDVVDPYGGSLMDYEDCFNELSRLIRKTAYRVTAENQKK